MGVETYAVLTAATLTTMSAGYVAAKVRDIAQTIEENEERSKKNYRRTLLNHRLITGSGQPSSMLFPNAGEVEEE